MVVVVYRLITLPLAGAAGLEPCTVEGAVEALMVAICRYARREEWWSLRQAKVAVGLSGTK